MCNVLNFVEKTFLTFVRVKRCTSSDVLNMCLTSTRYLREVSESNT